jgi:hypothetical protein
MQSTRKLQRIVITLSLLFALGVAPTLSVNAQQPARIPAKRSAKVEQKMRAEKQEAAEEDVPLSAEEMKNVKGGVAWFVPVAIGAAFAAGSAYMSHRSHQKILRSCTPTRR